MVIRSPTLNRLQAEFSDLLGLPDLPVSHGHRRLPRAQAGRICISGGIARCRIDGAGAETCAGVASEGLPNQVRPMLAGCAFIWIAGASTLIEIVAGRNWNNLKVVGPVLLHLAANITFIFMQW